VAKLGRFEVRASEEEIAKWVGEAQSRDIRVSVWARGVLNDACGGVRRDEDDSWTIPEQIEQGVPGKEKKQLKAEIESDTIAALAKFQERLKGERCFKCSRLIRIGQEPVKNCLECGKEQS
jgi:hypothetical protein